MANPLEALLVESEGIYLVQAGPGEPTLWCAAEAEARNEAEKQTLYLRKRVFVFRAIASVDLAEHPTEWTEYEQG